MSRRDDIVKMAGIMLSGVTVRRATAEKGAAVLELHFEKAFDDIPPRGECPARPSTS